MRGARSDCFEHGSSHQHNGVDLYCGTKPFLIGVAGGTASGKSTVCQKIVDSLNVDQTHHKCVEIIGQDCFYRELSETEGAAAYRGQFDFDHPDALDEKLMISALKDLKSGKEVTIPAYDFITNRRSGEKVVKPADVIIFEGILAFYYKDINSLFDLKLFVDTDADTRLARRVQRDMTERNRPLENILHQYITYVKPAFEEFCLPTKKHADVIIPRGADNAVAIDLIVQHLQDLLRNGHRPAEHAAVTRSLSVLSNDSSVSRPH